MSYGASLQYQSSLQRPVQGGKSCGGGKTVLDNFDLLERDLPGVDDPASAQADVLDAALAARRDRQVTVGRTRIFGEMSVWLNDAGVLAMRSVVRAVVGFGSARIYTPQTVPHRVQSRHSGALQAPFNP